MSDDPIISSVNPDQLIARNRLKRAAEGGNAEAQYHLGLAYGNGDDVPQDFAEAARWIALAAEQGHANAQATLGSMYITGRGVAVDEDKAREYFLKAAEAGLAKAQYVLATMYRFGQHGCEKNMQEAVNWYLEAANGNSTAAQLALGKLLMKGRHVQQDDEAALHWLTLAHVNGSKSAEEYIKELLQRIPRERLEVLMAEMRGTGTGDKVS